VYTNWINTMNNTTTIATIVAILELKSQLRDMVPYGEALTETEVLLSDCAHLLGRAADQLSADRAAQFTE